MRYYALAADYDGTLAENGHVENRVIGALERLRSSGRRSIMITGRRLEELQNVFPRLDLFDGVVVENGAVLYWPETREVEILGAPPPPEFLAALQKRGVSPLATGLVIVATVHPNEHAIIDTIRELALELHVVFNGLNVMVLPPRVNKASGLAVALRKLGLSPHEVVAIGNAANDHSFLELSECSVAVGDAEASIRSAASFTTKAGNGDGVVELIDELIANDLASRKPIGAGDVVVLGVDEAGRPVQLSPYGQNILVVGPSSSGKSTFAAGMIERLIDRSYQVCVIDPEGDYASLHGIATVGSRRNPPEIAHVIDILRDPSISLSVNLLGISLQDRPLFAADLFSQILALRVTTGRPHWVVVDEVHHLFPSTWSRIGMLLPQRLGETILITMRASAVVQQLVRLMDVVVAVGPSPEVTLGDAAAVLGVPTPKVPARSERSDECVVWFRTDGSEPRRMSTIPSRSTRLRHLRKYADGNLAYRSFFFRGPGGKLNLRAQNLTAFSQLLMGVDDETFLYHLRRGDYDAWLRGVIKDGELAAEVEKLRNSNRPPLELRHLITDAIDRRYAT